MSQRASFPSRSPAEWGVRAFLAAVAVALGFVSVSRTLANAVHANPQVAHALAPDNGTITASLAEKLLIANASSKDRAEADRLARVALDQDPTAVDAVTTLGAIAQLRGDTVRARRLLAYAKLLSRRNLQTELWAIEDAVSRNDIAGALRHYDIALRTARSAPDLLFPVLAAASNDEAIQSELLKTLSQRPAWGQSFIEYVAGNGPDPRSDADLLRGLQRVRVPVSEVAHSAAIRALIAGGFLNDAWSYYASVRPGVDRRMSRDPHFGADLSAPTPFDWVLIDNAGINTSIQRGDQGGIFDFQAPSSVGGTLLQQMQLLPPGEYRLQGHSVGIDQPDTARPYWVLSCRQGQELGRVAVTDSAQNEGRFAGRFFVPDRCPVQILALVARPSDANSGLAGQIDQVQLVPGG